MAKTLRILALEFRKTGHHIFTLGRKACYNAPDQIELGMDLIKNTKDTLVSLETSTSVDTEMDHELDAGDLAVVE